MKIIVIGAGVAGLSIGWRLQLLGAHVTIFDRAQPASAATWASAGMLAAGGEFTHAETPEAEFARLSSGLWPSFASEVEEASGHAVHYRRCGALVVQKAAHLWPGAERINRDQALAMEPMLLPDISGAIWAPDEAQVDSRALGEALALAFIRSGGTLIPNEVVLSFKVEGSGVVCVVTPFKRHEADAFVIAAGAWSSTIEGLPAAVVPSVKPIKGEMLSVVPPAGGRLPRHIVWGDNVYMVPRADRLLIGATSEDVGFDTSLTDAGAERLSKQACRLIPEIANWDVTERWAGLRPMSADGLPLLGHTTLEGLFLATGQYRNGILFAPAIARLMSRIILEGDVEIGAFDPRRFATG
ncbi:MAG TPA: glycine oxidase ThiO [Rhizomicrobium sp.]|jgi:glycine oxidase